jgi:uncharacterized membrane protein
MVLSKGMTGRKMPVKAKAHQGGIKMDKVSKREVLDFIKKDVKDELSDDEILHLILEKRVSKKETGKEKYTFGQKAADHMAKFAGSWLFVIGFVAFMAFWILLNIMLGNKAADPFPFILLNLMLSCVAAIQAPLIMMSQNRQEAKDRERAGNDYKVNLKTEIIIEDLYVKLEKILANQRRIEKSLREVTSEYKIVAENEGVASKETTQE